MAVYTAMEAFEEVASSLRTVGFDAKVAEEPGTAGARYPRYRLEVGGVEFQLWESWRGRPHINYVRCRGGPVKGYQTNEALTSVLRDLPRRLKAKETKDNLAMWRMAAEQLSAQFKEVVGVTVVEQQDGLIVSFKVQDGTAACILADFYQEHGGIDMCVNRDLPPDPEPPRPEAEEDIAAWRREIEPEEAREEAGYAE